MSSPNTEYMKVAYHVLRYLKLAIGKGMMLTADSTAHLSLYCDSDWANCLIALLWL